jgi:hypothetical protein
MNSHPFDDFSVLLKDLSRIYGSSQNIAGESGIVKQASLMPVTVWAKSSLSKQPLRLSGNQTLYMGRNSLQIRRTFLTGILSAGSVLTPLVTRAQDVQKNPLGVAAKPDAPSMSIKPYHAITRGQRAGWILSNTVGPPALAVGLVAASYDTARNEPEEYHGTWSGFGKRFGIRLSQTATSNVMEAGLGSLWGEDPRYFRSYAQPFKGRVKNVVISTFLAHNRNGQFSPAYARFVAFPGSNFLSNTWRADSEANTSQALQRTAWAFLGDMGKNAFLEFWPDFHRRVMHNKF